MIHLSTISGTAWKSVSETSRIGITEADTVVYVLAYRTYKSIKFKQRFSNYSVLIWSPKHNIKSWISANYLNDDYVRII